MISVQEKLALFVQFLNAAYYCDLSVARDSEEIETIKDTLTDYRDYTLNNVPEQSEELKEAMDKGAEAITECERLLNIDNYSDLSALSQLLSELEYLVRNL